MREMDWRVRAINKRRSHNSEFQMALNGVVPQKPKKKVELTDDQEKAMAIAIQKAKERKAKEYGRKTHNKNKR